MSRRPERLGQDDGPPTDGSHFGEALVALFLFGVVAFSPLVLDVFDPPPDLFGNSHSTVLVLGIPLLFLYLFVVWALLIALLWLIVERASHADTPAARPPHPGSEVE